jgi:glutathione S-transferase
MITLYRAEWSTNVERVALALAHKELEVESVVIDYADRSPVEQVSGQSLVPVIVDAGVVVADSAAILAHLEARYPDPPLFPAEVPDTERIADLAARMDGWLYSFERLLTGREYLMGEFGAADCIAFPFLKYARSRDPADDELFHVVLDDYQTCAGRPALEAWINRVDARPRALGSTA